jgi:hypothetical protein
MNFVFFASLFFTSIAFADCDIEPLRKEIIKQYSSNLPVTNEKGETGEAHGQDFVVSDYLMKIKNENFLIANFNLKINWKKGKDQLVKTLVVATVDESNCQIETFDSGDTMGSSMSAN